ncbi:MAG: hypothetical protein AB7I52_12110 [Rhizobiaceae bacterium]
MFAFELQEKWIEHLISHRATLERLSLLACIPSDFSGNAGGAVTLSPLKPAECRHWISSPGRSSARPAPSRDIRLPP